MKITLDTTHAIKGLGVIDKKVSDLAPLMRNLAGMLGDITENAFEYEMNPETSEKWANLSLRTILERQQKGYVPIKILVQTGQLAASIHTSTGSNFAQIGTNKDYAYDLQFGKSSKNLPARPFIGFSPSDAEEMEQMVNDYLG